MKVKTVETKFFKPVTFEITLDSLDDVAYMWCALNVPLAIMRENASYDKMLKHLNECEESDKLRLFRMIDDIAYTWGLKGKAL